MEKEEVINDAYLYLRGDVKNEADQWIRFRWTDYRARLMTWISLTTTRFFQKKRVAAIGNESSKPLLMEKTESKEEQIHQKSDVECLIDKVLNERYRFVLKRLILEDGKPQEVADEMRITVVNLYNIKRRALKLLARIARKEEGQEE